MKNFCDLGKNLLLAVVVASGASVHINAASITPVGTPGWEIVDAHLFSAAIGTPESGFAEFFETISSILPPPNHVIDSSGIIRPGAPHQPPYDQEIGNGLKNSGISDRTVFTANDFANGNGIFLAFMIVPGPDSVLGSSPDFASGPIIPNEVFPIRSVASTYKGANLFSAPSEFDTEALDGFSGFSHTPDIYADSLTFASDPGAVAVGSYEYRIVLTDSEGNGWNITAPFEIPAASVPEPAAVLLLGTGVAMLFAGKAGRVFRAAKKRSSGRFH